MLARNAQPERICAVAQGNRRRTGEGGDAGSGRRGGKILARRRLHKITKYRVYIIAARRATPLPRREDSIVVRTRRRNIGRE